MCVVYTVRYWRRILRNLKIATILSLGAAFSDPFNYRISFCKIKDGQEVDGWVGDEVIGGGGCGGSVDGL